MIKNISKSIILIMCLSSTFLPKNIEAASINVRFDNAEHSKPIIGFNFPYFDHAQGLVKEEPNSAGYTKFDEGILEKIKEIRPQWIRFPGGNPANNYDFEKAIGPLAFREPQIYYKSGQQDQRTNGTPFDDSQSCPQSSNFGPIEAAFVANEIDAELVIAVPLTFGAEKAANLVEYMNRGNKRVYGKLRQQHINASGYVGLHKNPKKVIYWELGNEYGAGNTRNLKPAWTHFPTDGHSPLNEYGDSNFPDEGTIKEWLKFGGSRWFKNQRLVDRNSWHFVGTGNSCSDSYLNDSHTDNDNSIDTRFSGDRTQELYVMFPPIELDSKNSLTFNKLNVTPQEGPTQAWFDYDRYCAKEENLNADGSCKLNSDARYYFVNAEEGKITFNQDESKGAIPPINSKLTFNYHSGPHDSVIEIAEAMKAIDGDIKLIAGGGLISAAFNERNPDLISGHMLHKGLSITTAVNAFKNNVVDDLKAGEIIENSFFDEYPFHSNMIKNCASRGLAGMKKLITSAMKADGKEVVMSEFQITKSMLEFTFPSGDQGPPESKLHENSMCSAIALASSMYSVITEPSISVVGPNYLIKTADPISGRNNSRYATSINKDDQNGESYLTAQGLVIEIFSKYLLDYVIQESGITTYGITDRYFETLKSTPPDFENISDQDIASASQQDEIVSIASHNDNKGSLILMNLSGNTSILKLRFDKKMSGFEVHELAANSLDDKNVLNDQVLTINSTGDGILGIEEGITWPTIIEYQIPKHSVIAITGNFE